MDVAEQDQLAAKPLDPPAEPMPPGSGADLLTIGLLVFFVSLLLVVAALLVLPAVLA